MRLTLFGYVVTVSRAAGSEPVAQAEPLKPRPVCRRSKYICEAWSNPKCISGHCNQHCAWLCKCGAANIPYDVLELETMYGE